jgi:RHS repeat-associated protein
MLTGYVGYDGFEQQFTYDANGMRLSKAEKGDTNRSTLEELLRGDIAGLPEVVAPVVSGEADGEKASGAADTMADPAAVEAGFEWATTEYLHDLTQEYYQVIEERTTGKNTSSVTAYDYGLQRIAAYSQVNGDGGASLDNAGGNAIVTKTSYVYDGRGSVAQTIAVPIPGADVFGALPESVQNGNAQVGVSQVNRPDTPQVSALLVDVPQITSLAYTPFGEQMNGLESTVQKLSGFGYNAEWYDAATGMQNLRARQYEAGMGRFGQKDALRGNIILPISQNRYAYALNIPTMFVDPSGMAPSSGVIEAFSWDFVNSRASYYRNIFKKASDEESVRTALNKLKQYYQKNKAFFNSNALVHHSF